MKKLRRVVKNENEKWCPICDEIKNRNEFSKGGGKDGLHSYCKKCTSEMNKDYYKNNKDYFKEYYKELHGLTSRFNATTKSRHYTQSKITEEQIKDMFEFFDYKCAYTNVNFDEIRLSFDHIIPLSEGGEHEIWNIVPCDLSCNASKKNRNLEIWLNDKNLQADSLYKIRKWQEYSFFKYRKMNKLSQYKLYHINV